MFTILVIGASYLLGYSKPLNENTFTVIKNYENVVILKQYNDIFICAKFDPQTKILKDEIFLLNISRRDSLVLQESDIGPLSVNKKLKHLRPKRPVGGV